MPFKAFRHFHIFLQYVSYSSLAGKPGVGGPFIEGAGKGLILETLTNATNITTTTNNNIVKYIKYTFYIVNCFIY